MTAPIALFAYNRPQHLQRTLEALRRNRRAADSDLIVYSDGGRDAASTASVRAVRAVLAQLEGFNSVRIVARESNLGLAESIIRGVTEVCAEYGRVIVLEDDLITSQYFLDYMNGALELYANDPVVGSVHGYWYPVARALPETFFLKGASCWGWATWSRAWSSFEPDGRKLLAQMERAGLSGAFDLDGAMAYTRMLRTQAAGKLDSWAIRWHASMFLADRLQLWPGRSLVQNIGFDGSGTHCGASDAYGVGVAAAPIELVRAPLVESAQARAALADYHRSSRNGSPAASARTAAPHGVDRTQRMKRYYCTLFDKNYLIQAGALYHSLLQHAGEFTLYALCMDRESYAMINKLRTASLIPVSVDELITEEVAAVRARTGHGQFCWVCQPLICRHVLDRYGADMVTYLEADSTFYSDPEPLFAELGSRSVSLVPHNYSAEFDNSAGAGRFCVQFNAFRNDAAARAVLDQWRVACFEYDKSAPTRYPGQTCMDEWPAKFQCVAVITHRGAGVAPWNIRGYNLRAGAAPSVDGVPVIFYHYHQYGRLRNGAHELGSYPMSAEVVDCFYRPYVRALRRAESIVRSADPTYRFRREFPPGHSLGEVLRAFSADTVRVYAGVLKRRLRGRYNVYPDEFFSD